MVESVHHQELPTTRHHDPVQTPALSPQPPRSSGQRIALFGGSFDPPHLGHVLCATWAYVVGRVDAVWVLPVHVHPYAKNLASWDDRWAMCRAAFAGLGFVAVRDDETRNPQGRTYDLLTLLLAEHPTTRFSLIGGSDTRSDIANWYRGEELLERIDLIEVPRRGYDDDHPAALPAISSTEIRRRLDTGEPIDGMLPPPVLDHIHQRGLYPPG